MFFEWNKNIARSKLVSLDIDMFYNVTIGFFCRTRKWIQNFWLWLGKDFQSWWNCREHNQTGWKTKFPNALKFLQRLLWSGNIVPELALEGPFLLSRMCSASSCCTWDCWCKRKHRVLSSLHLLGYVSLLTLPNHSHVILISIQYKCLVMRFGKLPCNRAFNETATLPDPEQPPPFNVRRCPKSINQWEACFLSRARGPGVNGAPCHSRFTLVEGFFLLSTHGHCILQWLTWAKKLDLNIHIFHQWCTYTMLPFGMANMLLMSILQKMITAEYAKGTTTSI